jgi:hypothetical protein
LSINCYFKEQDVLEMGYFNPQAKGLEAPTLLDPSEKSAFHLTVENNPVSEMFCSLQCWMMDKIQKVSHSEKISILLLEVKGREL